MAEAKDVAYVDQVKIDEEKRWRFCVHHYKGVLIIIIPLVLAPVLLGRETNAYRFLYLTLVTFLYFLFNVMPVGAIAFMYIIFSPVFGLENAKELCTSHYSDLIFQFVAVVCLGMMMDGSTMSQRLGLFLLRITGSRLRLIQIEVAVVTCLLSIIAPSMLVAGLICRIVIAMMLELQTQGVLNAYSQEETYEYNAYPYPSWPAIGIYLTVCYSSVIGSYCSPVNTPNTNLLKLYDVYMPDSELPNFATFFILMFAPMLIQLLILILWIQLLFFDMLRPKSAISTELREAAANSATVKAAVANKRIEAGPFTVYEIFASILIIIAFIATFMRKPLLFESIDDKVKEKSVLNSCILTFVALTAFIIPANLLFIKYCTCFVPAKIGTAPSLVGWKATNINMAWGHLFYLACGIGLVQVGITSGFYDMVNDSFGREYAHGTSADTLQLAAVGYGTIASIFSPADALVKKVVPLIFKKGHSMDIGAGTLAMPFFMATHPSFILPCSAGPNALIAGWCNIRTYQFFLGGIVPTIFGFILVYVFVMALGETAFPGYQDEQESLNLTLIK